MPRMRLTQIAVDRLKPPASGRIEYWDSVLPSFGLRVAAPRPGQDGRKTWQLLYRVNGKQVRETLGTVAKIPKVEEARALARRSMAKAHQGVHPVEERRRIDEQERQHVEAEEARQHETVAATIDLYLDRYLEKQTRPDTFREIRRVLERDVKPTLGSRPIREITRPDVRELIERIADRAPSAGNHAFAYMKGLFNWAVGQDLIAVNPCGGLKMPAPLVARDRYLDDDEIPLFWQACDQIGWPFGPLFQLLLLTAQRRDEVAEATWPEFDLEKGLWTLPRHRAKNDKAHLVQLSPLALEIIETLPRIGEETVFLFTMTGRRPVAGFGRAAVRLAGAIADLGGAVEHFTLHDLRRSAATGMAAIGIAHHVLDRVLNHTSGKISGVGAIYNRFEYLDERRLALDAWGRHVESLVRPVPSNVIGMRARAPV